MKIKKVEIENFGKLKNTKIEFEKGFQILYGKNEAGKSTLMEFIKIMLYKVKDNLIRKNRTPWDGTKMGGAIEFESKGKIYRFQKEFGNTPSKDKSFLRCVSDNTIIALGKKEEIGEKFLGIGSEDFERSGYIDSLGDKMCDKKAEKNQGIKDIMLNLISTGDENISRKTSEKNLNSAITTLLHKNGKGGEISDLKKEIGGLRDSIREAEKIQKEQAEIYRRISEIDNLIQNRNSLRKQIENLDRINRLKNLEELRNCLKKEEIYLNGLRKEGIDPESAGEVLNELISEKNNIDSKESEICNLKKDLEERVFIDGNFLKEIKTLEEEKRELKEKLESAKQSVTKVKDLLQKYDEIQENTREIKRLKDLQKRHKNINYIIYLAMIFVALGFLYFMHQIDKLNIFVGILGFVVCLIPFLINKFKELSYSPGQEHIIKLETEINFLQKSLYTELEAIKAQWDVLNKETECRAVQSQFTLDSDLELFFQGAVNTLANKIESICQMIKDKLKIKNCMSYDEAEKSYNERVITERLLDSREQALHELKEVLTNKISRYNRNIGSYIKAIEYLDNLNDVLKEKTKNHMGIEGFVKSLNIHNANLNMIEELISKISCKIDLNTKIEVLSTEKHQELLEKLEELENQELDNIRGNLKGKIIDGFAEEKRDMEEKLNNLEIELEQKEIYLKSLELAKEVLTESYHELKNKIGPKINESTAGILSYLTLEKYNTISVQDDCSILVKIGSFDREHIFFSSGTIDQAYLALRLALAEIISNNNSVPIILDDVLVRYDDDRLKSTIEYLRDYAIKNDIQILLFTCHDYIQDMGESYSIPLKLL